MEGLAGFSVGGRFHRLHLPSLSCSSKSSIIFHRRPGSLRVSASRDEGPKFDKWDQMELEFGRLLGEDPKLTLAKIMARKLNPDASYLDIEKEYIKKKGKLDDSMINALKGLTLEGKLLETPQSRYLSSQMRGTKSMLGNLNLSRPVMNKGMKASKPDGKPALNEKPPLPLTENDGTKNEVPSIPLRKPTTFQDDESEVDSRSKLKIKPNLSLRMRKDTDEDLSNATLLKKPEVIKISINPSQENAAFGDSIPSVSTEMEKASDDVAILNHDGISSEEIEIGNGLGDSDGLTQSSVDSSAVEGLGVITDAIGGPVDDTADAYIGQIKRPQLPKQSGIEYLEDHLSDTSSNPNLVNSASSKHTAAPLLEKPNRLQSSMMKVPHSNGKEEASLTEEGSDYAFEKENLNFDSEEEKGNDDWERAEKLCNTGERDEVELVSCSSRGFVVSFGSLVGFLPYRNLGAKWKFLAFESWLRKKGLDPSLYRQNLGISRKADVQVKHSIQNTKQGDEPLPLTMRIEDLLEAYDGEKAKFLSSFIGQRIRVAVQLADRKSRKLIFSGRPKEKEEIVEKKRRLMAKLGVGDIVKCSVKRITYFGIFVDVEEVPALIPQSEVSWDTALDPSSIFKIGQTLDAKVLELDYGLERITLSLKEVTPDPLMETLESVVGDGTSLGGRLEASHADVEWSDVDVLIKELQKFDGVQSVNKGRFFLSPGLAPTFQVYMAAMFDNQYKLLARYGNKVQEVIVQSSMDREEMKTAILTCTNRV
ncbi:putative nucleic acid-binding, RNA-binding domain, S1 [Dioscorea sansibarensis]